MFCIHDGNKQKVIDGVGVMPSFSLYFSWPSKSANPLKSPSRQSHAGQGTVSPAPEMEAVEIILKQFQTRL